MLAPDRSKYVRICFVSAASSSSARQLTRLAQSQMATIELNALNTAHNTQHHAITSNFLTEDSNISNPNNDLGTSGDGDNDPKDINDIFTTFDQETPIDIHPEWRRNIFALMEQPTSSPAAFLVHVMITGLIVLSALVTILETVPAFHSIGTKVWFAFETMLVVLFTFEYAARCLAWSWSWRSLAKWTLCEYWIRSLMLKNTEKGGGIAFFGIIDLLSVLPYYIELALGADTVRVFSVLTFDGQPLTRLGFLVRPLSFFDSTHVPPTTSISAIQAQ